ncbi:hypothetical protein E4T43_06219 [Aureobasidium subglaciale]|nr:hypothetical protein E4T43_06219 [Aureobasidium subglaciale]
MDIPEHMRNFVTAMQQTDQNRAFLDSTSDVLNRLDWKPPPMKDGHRGRHLWTDAFGVLNFITLFKETSQPHFLVLAAILVETVHDALGRTRNLSARLPGASDMSPLAGGLRIGKTEASGSDGDGQYHHYLTLWMLALNRLCVATGERSYNDQAVVLAQAIHPAFVYQRDSPHPSMVWKMSMDLSHPLGRGEGNMDPINGLVVFKILQQTNGDMNLLQDEIMDYQRIVDQKGKAYTSSDTLDLGMVLWAAHWYANEHDWASKFANAVVRDMRILFQETHYLDMPIGQRLAFREFGTCLGINCHPTRELRPVRDDIIVAWETAGRVPVPIKNVDMESLEPIDLVMYAAALCSGAFERDYLN